MVFRGRSLGTSLIGGLAETQEMLDFSGEHGITSDVEVIAIPSINEAYARMLKSDAKYRFASISRRGRSKRTGIGPYGPIPPVTP